MADLDVNFAEAEKKWVPLIGQFMIGFVGIENSMHEVIKSYISESLINESDITERFGDRLKLFHKILNSMLNENKKNKLNEVIISLNKLKATRNLIAHNSLSLSFEKTKNGELRGIGFQISSRRNENVGIKYAELARRTKELVVCRNALAELMMDFHTAQLHKLENS
jgi:hypothetical protein